jgi:hypothetical protein
MLRNHCWVVFRTGNPCRSDVVQVTSDHAEVRSVLTLCDAFRKTTKSPDTLQHTIGRIAGAMRGAGRTQYAT